MIKLNEWEYTPAWSEEFMRFEGTGEAVRLPHNAGRQDLHYATPQQYEGIAGYRRHLSVPEEQKNMRLFLQFDGAAHIADVFVNGQTVAHHACGYTAFRAEITDAVRFGAENEIALRLDTTENPAIPPFGYVIDYLTYGGLYRDAWLDVRPKDYIEDLFIQADATGKVHLELTVSGAAAGAEVQLADEAGDVVFSQDFIGNVFDFTLPGAHLWSIRDPYRYTVTATLRDENGQRGDSKSVRFGFRTAKFTKDDFFLNGEKVFLRGLNRHQSYPWNGYAVPEHLQREDARILKEELGCTAVRTSHYPQSHYFIDECDRIGLLVFTEIPGWQHIGDEGWQDQAVENTREMVLQYRNHPSIVLWGVRINESQDNDELYRRTNEVAHSLDPSRATSGVRYIENSHLLEDVYAYNDFSFNGQTAPLRQKQTVTKEQDKALLISEMNGHMFPTKPYDPWQKREEHALRHAKVQGAALRDGEHVGCFAWCMFDYATHAEFGSGDRICYHGVMDSFRNPKLAAAIYASQQEETPVLEVSSSMDIGDYPAGIIGSFYIFTNADEVDVYRNGKLVNTLKPEPLFGLTHEPIHVTDTIGRLLETEEGFTGSKERLVRRGLNAMSKYGATTLPVKEKLALGWCMIRHGLSYAEGVRLYGKYVGGWGDALSRWSFEGKKDGKVVSRVEKGPGNALHIDAKPSKTVLEEDGTYDMIAVRISIVDDLGNLAVYAQLPVTAEVSGPLEIAGPSVVTAEGGATGIYLKSTGVSGNATLTLTAPGLEPCKIEFKVNV